MSAENATHDHTPYTMYIIHTYIELLLNIYIIIQTLKKFKKPCTGSMLGSYIHVVNTHTYIHTYIHWWRTYHLRMGFTRMKLTGIQELQQ